MSAMAHERSWLLDPSLLKLVHQCRRLIHSEFGVKLHLTEAQLGQRLASYVEQSRSDHLARTWAQLQDRVPDLQPQAAEEPPKRMYRGQAIAEPEPRPATAETGGGDAPPWRSKVIYRGQVVG